MVVAERATFTGISVREHDEEFDFMGQAGKRRWSMTNVLFLLFLFLSLLATVLSIAALVESTKKNDTSPVEQTPSRGRPFG